MFDKTPETKSKHNKRNVFIMKSNIKLKVRANTTHCFTEQTCTICGMITDYISDFTVVDNTWFPMMCKHMMIKQSLGTQHNQHNTQSVTIQFGLVIL